MFAPDDTIVAIATPPGRGGIGVVRVSGPDSLGIADALIARTSPLEPRRATLTRVIAGGPASPEGSGEAGHAIDRAVVTFFPAPHSYTGEDVLEISAHGSPVLLRGIVEAAMHAGARLAEPGEFTFRAFIRGRIDLVQAEAVQDLVEAVTPLQARAAFDQLEGTLTTKIGEIDAALFDLSARLEASLDFADEGYHFVEAGAAAREILAIVERIDALLADARRGRLVREGAQVAIVGRPNSGKSSLFNRLAGSGRAIVTDIPGTTRDLVTEVIEIEGAAVTLIDTAGIHGAAADVVEQEGIARAHAAREVADLVLLVLDRSRPLTQDDRDLLAACVDHLHGPSSTRRAALHGPPSTRRAATHGPSSTRRAALDGPPSTRRAATHGPPSTRRGATHGPPSTRRAALHGPPSPPCVVVANKSDLHPAWAVDALGTRALLVSARDGTGLDELRDAISMALSGGERWRDAPAITNVRHIDLLSSAAAALRRAADAAGSRTPEEFVTADVAGARALLEEVTGARTADDVLHAIFDKFCIGK